MIMHMKTFGTSGGRNDVKSATAFFVTLLMLIFTFNLALHFGCQMHWPVYIEPVNYDNIFLNNIQHVA